MMITNNQKLLKLAFVSLFFFVFAACSSDDDKGVDVEPNANHSFDIELKRNGEVITYSQSFPSNKGAGIYEIDEDGDKVIHLWFEPGESLDIIGNFVLNENNVPYNLDYLSDEKNVSLITIIDKTRPDFIAAASGSLTLSNLKVGKEVPGTVGKHATFTVEFVGVFHHQIPSGEILEYEGTGKIVVSPWKLD